MYFVISNSKDSGFGLRPLEIVFHYLFVDSIASDNYKLYRVIENSTWSANYAKHEDQKPENQNQEPTLVFASRIKIRLIFNASRVPSKHGYNCFKLSVSHITQSVGQSETDSATGAEF